MSSDIYEAEYALDDSSESFGLWRDGQLVVVEIAAHRFPNRCLKTDAPVQGPQPAVGLKTSGVLVDELNMVTALFSSSTRRPLKITRNNKGNSVVVPLAVPLVPDLQRKVNSRFGLFLALGSFIFTLVMIVAMMSGLADNWFLVPVIGCVLGAISMIAGFTFMMLRTSRIVSIQRLADRKVWLRGAHPAWLARLPKYEISPELLARDYKRAVSSAWWSFGTAIVFGLAAAVCIPMAITGYFHGLASRDWPEATAKIYGAKITSHRSKSSRWWTVDFQYEFQLQNQSFSGSGSERDDSLAAAEINLQNKPDGTLIAAFYNPASPADNRLERGISDGEVGWMIGAVIVSLIAVSGTGLGIRYRSRAAAFRLLMDQMVGPLDDDAVGERFGSAAS